MPSKNIIKIYIENGYYHIYNRGVEKREIFLSEADCKIFLHYIYLYLTPIDEILIKYPDKIRIKRFLKYNLSNEVELICFALMPNHFHFLIKQNSKYGIIKFMRRLMTSYAMYFNKKYNRVGTLFQGRYKAVIVDKDEYLLHLSRYIHLNPSELSNSIFNNYTSYKYYIDNKHPSWIKPDKVLAYFSSKTNDPNISTYESFVEEYKDEALDIIEVLAIDHDKDGP